MDAAEKRIRKLRKSRLWPSILLFIVSILLGAILIIAEFNIYATHVVETKYAEASERSEEVARGLEMQLSEGIEPQVAVEAAAKSLGADNPLAICSPAGSIIASYGDITIDPGKALVIDADASSAVYMDKAVSSEFDSAYSPASHADDLQELESVLGSNKPIYQLDPSQLIVRAAAYIASERSDSTQEGVLKKFPIWQVIALGDSGDRALIKNSIPIRMNDIGIGVALIAVAGAFFLIVLSLQFVGVIRQVLAHRRLERLWMTDNTTGGNNWIGFEQDAAKVMAKRQNIGKLYAVVDLSIDKFQSMASLHGTASAKDAVVTVWNALISNLDENSPAGYTGEGNFALMLVQEPGSEAYAQVENVIRSLFRECHLALTSVCEVGKTNTMRCGKLDFSAGVNLVGPTERFRSAKKALAAIDFKALYINAGIAKDSLDQEEGDHVGFFNLKMWDDQMWRHKVENTMQAALDNEEFQVYIQPKYNPKTDGLQGAEALVRWVSPAEGMIPPGKFIPIFEETGFITKLDDYMISHVAQLQSSWLSEGKHVVPISVNVSRSHFAQPNLAEHIRDLVDAWNVPHSLLEIELTESAFFDDKKALLDTVHKLQDYGFDVSMDDFGSGYSSLNSLKDLPLNVLKLDADFFRGDDFDTRGRIVVSEAISLAKQLNMRIVAEGVEKEEQVAFLAGQDCDMIQGYYYAKPMSADEYAGKLG